MWVKYELCVIYERRESKDGFLSFFIDCYEKNEKKEDIIWGGKNCKMCEDR